VKLTEGNTNVKKRAFIALLMLISLLLGACRSTVAVMADPSDGAGRGTPSERDPEVTTETAEPDDGIPTICIDPGHGFDDVGAWSEYIGELHEKDINLEVALLLRRELEARGLHVVLTHDGESFPKADNDDGNNLFRPQERIAYARTLKIDYYFSIHSDSYDGDSSVGGTRIYYSAGTAHTGESSRAAEKIRDAINAALPDSKKTVAREMSFDDAYYVIREAPVPSALIEVGFVTNSTDARNMLDAAWRAAVAAAVADGIAAYFGA